MVGAYDATRGLATFILENLSVWESDGNSWRDAGTIAGMEPRTSFAVTYDPLHRQLVVFGGGESGTLVDTWVRTDGTWTRAATAGPPGRNSSGMAFDGSRVILFGGLQGPSQIELGDTWAWDGSSWTQLSPPTSPSPRGMHQMAYDPVHERVVLFGGRTGSETALDDLWEWDGTTWTQITATVHPPGRYRGAFAFDPTRQRLVLFGGRGNTFDFDDTWELEGSTWRQLVVENHPVPQNTTGFVPSPHGLLLSGHPSDGAWRLSWESVAPVESCSSGLDLDGDLAIGCDDADCWWACAPSCPPETSCDPSLPRCGDGTCNVFEDCRTCTADCGACNACGDARCEAGEVSCLGDCTL
jgi:hypothetical protein